MNVTNTGILSLKTQREWCFYCDPLGPCGEVKAFNQCDICRANMKEGIVLVSKTAPDETVQKRTGFRTMVSEKWVRQKVSPPSFAEKIIRERFSFVSDQVWEMLGLKKSKKLLFCAIVEYSHGSKKNHTITVDHIYCHAADMEDASFQVRMGEPQSSVFRIVAIAPVVGFFVHDEHGDKLSTS